MNRQAQTVVLTGASSGIGAAAAHSLALRGHRVCLLARSEGELRAVRDDIAAGGGTAWVYPVDIADPLSVESCARRLLADHDRIDVLVNNAARSIRRRIADSLDRAHDYERTIALNYLGAVRLTLALLPRFLEQKSGHVVNVSSMSTQVPIPLFSAYLASKSALESFTRSLTAELGDQGISGTVVHFPMVRTPMSSRTAIYRHMPMMDVSKAASLLVRSVERHPNRVTTLPGFVGGVAMAILPGLTTTVTRPMFSLMDRQLARRLNR